MVTKFHESNIDWVFEDGWSVIQYDRTIWYRKHFQSCAHSAGVDFVAFQNDGIIGWLIEVKNFRIEPPMRSKDLVEIITKKARDTLSGLLAGAINANIQEERDFFVQVSTRKQIRIAFHCERPAHKSKLFKRLPDAADLKQKLEKSLRAIDRRVVVLDCTSGSAAVPWTATWHPNTGAT